MLSHEETLLLLKEAQSGSDEAKEKLIVENIPLVKSIVKRFKGRLEYDDLMQLGSMGFVKAILNFKEEYGVRFSTYAVPLISGEIKRYLRDDGQVKVSRWAKMLSSKISQYIDEKQKLGEPEPTVDELAEVFDCEKQDIVFAMETNQFLLSLSESIDEDGSPLEDRISGGKSPDDSLDEFMLKDSIAGLPERDRKIIILRYFRDKTQSEVAKELGISQVQVSRIETKILQKLKEVIEA
ncbi:MAG: sigma-70 family RNA polymerase sigma factor [Clostridia bacterium]|nr:sigma-70 family RNA polymerase sigma factor [Clostridia bacterium]